MSALRYSGEIRIRVTYREPCGETYSDGTPRFPNGSYRCHLTGPGGMKTTIIVGAPVFLSHAVDSSEAFDEAAHAAISFADHKDAEADDPHVGTPLQLHKVGVPGYELHAELYADAMDFLHLED